MTASPTAMHPADLALYHRNPRLGNVEAIAGSLRANGQYKPIVVNAGTHTGRPNEVLAGNHTLKAIRDLAEKHPDDERWQTVLVHVIDVDDDRAARIVLADNRTSELGTMDDTALADLLDTLDGDLEGTGYDDDDLAHLAHQADAAGRDADTDQDYDDGDATPTTRRTAPLDLVFTGAPSDVLGLLAFRLGWEPGCISSSLASIKKYQETTPNPKRMAFVDNEWHGYDHAQHIAALQYARPKYGTVRDLLTEQQAREADVEFFTIAETLAMAEEVAQYCDNVILIPKYDCIDELPRTIGGKPVVLGYSVRSSYGGTEIPARRFAGWPVHLLGGSWRDQRALLNLLGDDVVSLDNNLILKKATFGGWFDGEGKTHTINDLLGYSSFTMAAAVSLANIVHYVTHQFGVDLDGTDEVDTDGGVEH